MMILPVLILDALGLLLWFGIYREWNAAKAYKAKVNNETYKPLGLRIFFILSGILGQVIYWIIILGIVGSTAKSNLSALNHTANAIYRLSEQWLDTHENENLEGIYCFADEAEPDSFPEYLQKMENTAVGWYAIVCDENHKPEYVLYSKNEITEEKIDIPEKDEQLKILSRLIRDRGEAIGYSHADYKFRMT